MQAHLLADLNGDCIPEILMPYGYKDIAIVDTKTGVTIKIITTPVFSSNPTNIAVADIDLDDIPEIFIAVSYSGNNPLAVKGRIICIDVEGNVKWTSNQGWSQRKNSTWDGNLGLADFNQDGIPEIYIENKIFNAQTGVLLVDGGVNGLGYNEFSSRTMAGQLDDDRTDLELAAGYSIYKIKITNSNGTTGNTITPYNILIDGKYRDGKTSLADINGDGILDVLVHSELSQNDVRLYVYTLAGGTAQLIAQATPPTTKYKDNAFHSSIPVIGDISGTGNNSILVIRSLKLLQYSYDGSNILKLGWTFPTTDRSGFTGTTLFDLDANGVKEIIYRDETNLYIIDGSGSIPKIIDKTDCISGTFGENPIIGDAFNKGESNICVTCGNSSIFTGKVVIFGSPDSLPPWAPARRIWNQNAYNVLNINDDLTVPQYQKNNATYKNGRYNNFMAQQSLLDSNGYYKVRAGSLHGLIQCINYDALSDEYTVFFDVFNRVDASLTIPAGMPVAFFNGDPQAVGTLIGVYYTTSDIPPGGSLTNLSYSFSAANLAALFMVVNSDKTNFNPIDEEDFLHPECDYLDNFSQNTSIPQVELRVDSICNGDSYIFGDTTLTTAGQYYRSYQNVSGCDSLYVSLELDVIDTLLFITKYTACDSFEWRGAFYTQSGIYAQNFVSVNGCDSTVAIDLLLHHASLETIVQTACDSFVWKGELLTQSGTYTYKTLNRFDCDSTVTLELTINSSVEASISKTVCDAFDWHGNTYDQTGQYRFDTLTRLGCDSTVTLNLFIRDTIKAYDIIHICRGDSVWVFGQIIKDNQRISQSFVTAEGCDSIQTFKVIVDPLLEGMIIKNICEGDSVFIIDRWFKNEGNFTLSKSNIDACDSLYSVQIAVLNNVSSYDTLQLCAGDTLYVLGTEVTQEMDLMNTFMANNGCDSLVHFHVQMMQPSSSQIAYTLCPGDSLFVNGSWIKEEGIYTEIVTAINGCDSITMTHVKVLEKPQGPTAQLDCESLEITASVEIQNPWSIRWDNGYTTAQTTYKNQTKATLTLFAQPNCVEEFTIDLPPIPRLGEALSLSDTSLVPGSTLTLDLGLDPKQWSVLWSPSGAVDCDTCMQVVIAPKENVQITLSLRHISGCSYETTFAIRIAEQGIYIPNVFTPNGDGINDDWQVFHTPNITLLHIQVYDRWGDLVFDSDYQNTLLWDGRFNNQNAPPAVYAYVVQYRNAGGETKVTAGDVTLVR